VKTAYEYIIKISHNRKCVCTLYLDALKNNKNPHSNGPSSWRRSLYVTAALLHLDRFQ